MLESHSDKYTNIASMLVLEVNYDFDSFFSKNDIVLDSYGAVI
jgi:hypothetical protein